VLRPGGGTVIWRASHCCEVPGGYQPVANRSIHSGATGGIEPRPVHTRKSLYDELMWLTSAAELRQPHRPNKSVAQRLPDGAHRVDGELRLNVDGQRLADTPTARCRQQLLRRKVCIAQPDPVISGWSALDPRKALRSHKSASRKYVARSTVNGSGIRAASVWRRLLRRQGL